MSESELPGLADGDSTEKFRRFDARREVEILREDVSARRALIGRRRIIGVPRQQDHRLFAGLQDLRHDRNDFTASLAAHESSEAPVLAQAEGKITDGEA